MRKRQKSAVLRAAILAGYRNGNGKTPAEIADATGSTVGSVKVIAHKMGINDTPRVAAAKRWSRKTGRPFEEHLNPGYVQSFEHRRISRELMRDLGLPEPIQEMEP